MIELDFDFCLGISIRFDNKHTRSCLASRRSVSIWVGTCDTRGHGPPAQCLSLLFSTLVGAWPLSPLAPAARGLVDFDFCLSSSTHFWTTRKFKSQKHRRSCLASRRSVSGWGHVAHGARALQPNGSGVSNGREILWVVSKTALCYKRSPRN